jgi:hypothetical protein
MQVGVACGYHGASRGGATTMADTTGASSSTTTQRNVCGRLWGSPPPLPLCWRIVWGSWKGGLHRVCGREASGLSVGRRCGPWTGRAIVLNCDLAMAPCGCFLQNLPGIRFGPSLCIGRPTGRVCTVVPKVRFRLDMLPWRYFKNLGMKLLDVWLSWGTKTPASVSILGKLLEGSLKSVSREVAGKVEES